MASAITYEGVISRSSQRDADTGIALFAGQKLFFSHTVPQRQWLMQNAESNGATLTTIDTQADFVLFDHTKKNVPPGAISYRYVELSIRNGVLEDPGVHRIASESRVTRPVGSMKTAPKGGRNAFTEAEDQLLWNWIKPFMDAGGSWKGNEIYKQLESFNPRHTFQSWRDRWLRHTMHQNRQITADVADMRENVLPEAQPLSDPDPERSPKRRKLIKQEDEGHKAARQPSRSSSNRREESISRTPPPNTEIAHQETDHTQADHIKKEEKEFSLQGFTPEEARLLFAAAPSILVTDPAMLDHSWTEVAKARPSHTKNEWRTYFELVIVSEYRRRNRIDTEVEWQRHLDELILREQGKAPAPASREADEDENPASPSEKVASQRQQHKPTSESMNKPQRMEPRAPEPNESRRRSHARSTQSESISQSQSQSQSQRSGNTNDMLPIISQDAENPVNATGLVPLSSSASGHDPKTLASAVVSATALSKNDVYATVAGEVEDEQRFVTQVTTEKSISSQHEELRNSPSQYAIVPLDSTGVRRDSPLFFSESLEEFVKQESDNDSEEMQLVDELGHSSEVYEHSSDYAPSEAASMMEFEQRPDLSIAWETAPEHGEADNQSDHTEPGNDGSEQFKAGSSAALRRSIVDEGEEEGEEEEGKEEEEDEQEGEDVFETAPTLLRSLQESSKTQTDVSEAQLSGPAKFARQSYNQDVNLSADQALITRPESRRLVSPGNQSEQGAASRKSSRLSTATNIEDDEVEKELEEDDVDAWLANEKNHYSDVDATVLEEICLRSLESTSLQLETASHMVATLVSSYTKGKHPAMRHFDEINSNQNSPALPGSKRRRKSKTFRKQVAQVIDMMIPSDFKGVWTKEDDQRLTGSDVKGLKLVERKHGEEGVRLRFEYLEQLYKDT